MTRVLVCGGRDFADRALVFAALNRVHVALRFEVLIHGDCRDRDGKPCGADALAGEWARSRRVPEVRFPVSKQEWRTLGKKAGPMRNARMLREGRPDVVIAFPGERGTADMMKQAKRAGVPVHEVRGDGAIEPEILAKGA